MRWRSRPGVSPNRCVNSASKRFCVLCARAVPIAGCSSNGCNNYGPARCNCGSNSEHGASLSERISKASEGRARRGMSAFWRVLKKSPCLSCMATSVGTKITAHKDRAGDSCLAVVGKTDLGYLMRQSCSRTRVLDNSLAQQYFSYQ